MAKVHEVLGTERISQIGDQFNLSDEDKRCVDQILERWEGFVGSPLKKIEVALELVGNNPHHESIVQAMLLINVEFAQKAIRDRIERVHSN